VTPDCNHISAFTPSGRSHIDQHARGYRSVGQHDLSVTFDNLWHLSKYRLNGGNFALADGDIFRPSMPDAGSIDASPTQQQINVGSRTWRSPILVLVCRPRLPAKYEVVRISTTTIMPRLHKFVCRRGKDRVVAGQEPQSGTSSNSWPMGQRPGFARAAHQIHGRVSRRKKCGLSRSPVQYSLLSALAPA